MLPPAALRLADRIATALMILARATGHIGATGSTPTFPQIAAQLLFFRLCDLVTRLIEISYHGIRPTRPKPHREAPIGRQPADPSGRSTEPSMRLPTRPGWLLDALPEIAPDVAAELSALLADPAIAPLLDAAPSLHRTLRSILRALGLDDAPPIPTAPPPITPSPVATPPNTPPPRSSTPPIPTTASKLSLPDTEPFHARFVAMSQQCCQIGVSGPTPHPSRSEIEDGLWVESRPVVAGYKLRRYLLQDV